jgi:plastocyanin
MRARLAITAALGAALGSTVARAAPAAQPGGRVAGVVRVTEADGRPAEDADVIVYVVGFSEPGGDEVTTIAQVERTFVPDLVAITVNERVAFPNFDPFLHNVFSQSAARKFDLGSFRRGESKDKQFPMPGVVDVYCNIHPEMAATILVLPNRRHVRVKPDGHFAIPGVPPGDWTVFAYTRRATKPVSARISVKPNTETAVELALVRGAEPAHLNKYGEKYHDGVPQVYR